jgi:hypothetical protein
MQKGEAVVHYHICWSNSKLDWQAFSAPEEAQIEAEKLVRPRETYTIDKFDGDCYPQCQAVQAHSKRSPGN